MTGPGPGVARGATLVREDLVPGDVPLYAHPAWAKRFPWLAQGTTARGGSADPFDLRAFGSVPSGALFDRWASLCESVGCVRGVHARQVHGAIVAWHEDARPGFWIGKAVDGHATQSPGVLLTVSVADCVPVSVVDERRRAVALVHAGWRGIAGGILEAGLTLLARRAASRADELYVHLGPAICGACYEVGPEVHRALALPDPGAPTPIDLRAVLVDQALALGVREARITRSAHCTRCGDSPFFSHRAGHAGRQFGVLGVRGAG